MGTRYYKLFDLLNRRGMKKSDLRQILSPKTVAKLSKGEYLSGEAIEKICVFLNCQPGDIMEIVVNEETDSSTGAELFERNYIAFEDEHGDITATDFCARYKGNETVLNTDNPNAQ